MTSCGSHRVRSAASTARGTGDWHRFLLLASKGERGLVELPLPRIAPLHHVNNDLDAVVALDMEGFSVLPEGKAVRDETPEERIARASTR